MSCTKTCRTRRLLPVLVLLVLPLLVPGATWADITYKIQPIARQGDELKVGDLTVKIGELRVGTLNDAGQLVFAARAGAGPLLQYAEGKFTPIAIGGGDAPGGQWPKSLNLNDVVSMNQRGNVVFGADVTIGGKQGHGTFLWDAQAKQVTAVTVPGMPTVNSLTAVNGSAAIPAINNRDEIALGATVKDTTGPAQLGLFFRGRDGKLVPVLLPDQELPGGGKIVSGGSLTVTDAGVVGFMARRQGDGASVWSAYLWEQGTLTPVVVIGQDAPGGGKIERVTAVRVNNQNRAVLLAARLAATPTQTGLYRFAEGQLTPVAVPGQEMPSGGKLQGLQESSSAAGQSATFNMSRASEAGQIAFVAKLEGGGHGVYRVEADGKLALILKEGDTTQLGPISRIPEARGIGLNGKGQVALAVKIADGPETLVLLTPTTP